MEGRVHTERGGRELLQRQVETGLVGDGIADGTDSFQLEHMELELVRDALHLRFEQVYDDGTRMRWSGELDGDLANIMHGQWTALSGAGIGARVGTFSAVRVNPARTTTVAGGSTEDARARAGPSSRARVTPTHYVVHTPAAA